MAYQSGDLRKALRKAMRRIEFDDLVPALMGKRTGAATWVNDVDGDRGLKYARVIQGNAPITVIQCINEAGVSDASVGTGEIPIWVRQVEGARWAIVKERFDK